MLGSYAAMVIFGCISAGWLFNFPRMKFEIALIFFTEEIWFFIPFLLFYLLHKKIGFDKALWLFPLIWMLWEWVYLSLEFTMGTHLSPYSQSNLIWLIQYLDITGMWGVSLWLMFFNILIFKAYQSVNYSLQNTIFYKKVAFITIYMVGIPLVYAGFSYVKYHNPKGKSINVTIIPTNYDTDILDQFNSFIPVVEQTLHRTDSIALAQKQHHIYSDLFLWPETGLPFTMQQTNLSELLAEAVNDWDSALLTGVRGVTEAVKTYDQRNYVSGVLISSKNNQPIYHHKTVLTPGQEVIPYHSVLAKIPNFPVKETDSRFFKKGIRSEPLELTTTNNQKFKIGVSLCYEQWFPQHWAALARNGAEFYTHLAGEGWYGKVGFMRFMTNVTIMRSIENRKQTARAANVGMSGCIDQMGRFHDFAVNGTLQPIQTPLIALQKTTFYAKYPNAFPLLGLGIFITALIFSTNNFYNLKNKTK